MPGFRCAKLAGEIPTDEMSDYRSVLKITIFLSISENCTVQTMRHTRSAENESENEIGKRANAFGRY